MKWAVTPQKKTTFKKLSLIRVTAGGEEKFVTNLKFKFSVIRIYNTNE